ncbi:hypothetical protein [Bifidobacterium tissieri]|uniref:DUF1109 domain-containing protein n=1 Tax=Bifidobacterium tissieri TaxID=1630162 RepID=A0A5M9ZJ09_9BIFI|nr:hypothetical protein [Bifidobacterium tissieri]KAA8827607.1 hypothetical protein EMO89_10205 [Bifidobacterium tissieri]KAA8830334.1 hypothetical protein EM849_10200 [Bifidobacterium tissieri]
MTVYHAGDYRKHSRRGSHRGKGGAGGNGGNGGGKLDRNGRVSLGPWNPLCAIAGVLAVLSGCATAARAIAPARMPELFAGIPVNTLIILTVALAVITLILVIVARRVAHKAGVGHGIASTWGIIALVLSLMLAGCGWAANTLFPQGVVEEKVLDAAPIDDPKAMEADLDKVFGTCTSGWQGMDASSYPGVKSVEMCSDTRVVFAVFDNDTSVGIYKAPIASKAREVLAQYQDQAGNAKYSMLAGKRWVLVGEQKGTETLQKTWGGSISNIE